MANLEERLEALEAQNSALLGRIDELEGRSARRGPTPGHSSVDAAEAIDDTKVDRRSLLRNLGGAAAAGVGLFAAQAATSPQPALADHGATLMLGHLNVQDQDNEGTGTRRTTLEAEGDPATYGYPHEVLRLNNTGIGPALNVASASSTAPLTIEVVSSAVGGDTGGLASVGSDTYADLLYFHSGDGNKTDSPPISGKVLTTNFAQYIDFPAGFPKRAVETRSAHGEKNHPAGSGSLSGQHTIDLSGELPAGTSGILGSITVVPQNNAPGYLRFWSEGTEPDTSNLAWSGGQIETTSIATAVTDSSTFEVFISGNVHLVLDLVAVTKND